MNWKQKMTSFGDGYTVTKILQWVVFCDAMKGSREVKRGISRRVSIGAKYLRSFVRWKGGFWGWEIGLEFGMLWRRWLLELAVWGRKGGLKLSLRIKNGRMGFSRTGYCPRCVGLAQPSAVQASLYRLHFGNPEICPVAYIFQPYRLSFSLFLPNYSIEC